MRTRQSITISLPPKMAEQVEETMKVEHRTRSELVREALRTYFAIRRFPEETPTAAELRAIRRGEAAYRKGDYVTLEEYLSGVDRRSRRACKKVS
jgi:metal-responsive CopG/Arc/MetJ family transcriptional regulator